MPDLEQLAGRIVHFLRTDLGVEEEITPDLALVTNGLIDSAGLMRLAAFIERETGLRVPDKDVTVAHFDTIRQITAYLRQRAGA
jgi:acyl carrier protein